MTLMLNNIEVTGDPKKKNLTEVWLKGFKQNRITSVRESLVFCKKEERMK